MRSKECRENVMKLSKSQAAEALLTEKKSVGEKDHPNELRDGKRPGEVVPLEISLNGRSLG